MDTPNRNIQQQQQQPTPQPPTQQQQQNGTPNNLRQQQDSPLYRYLENLSPIQPFQSVYRVHSVNLPSVPPVFKSPHINMKKEGKPIYRYPLSDLSKSEFFSQDADGKNRHVGSSNVEEILDHTGITHEDDTFMNVLSEPSTISPDKRSAPPTKECKSFEYDSSSPNHNSSLSCTIEPGFVMARKSMMEIIQALEGNNESSHVSELGGLEENEVLREIQTTKWMDLLPDADVGLTAPDCASHKDHDSSCKLSLMISQSTDNVMAAQPDGYFGVCDQNVSQEPFVEQGRGFTEINKIDCTSHILSTCEEKLMKGKPHEKMDNGSGEHCNASGSKLTCQQRFMRRRCLTFEMSATRKMPSIGLHLNALASLQKDGLAQDSLPSNQPADMPCSVSPFSPMKSEQKTANTPMSAEKDNPELNVQKPPVVLGCLQAPVCEKSDDCHNSPKKKKRRTENGKDGDSCKRCNCKKSKCLKLYCECFAAGVYCVELCSCQGCLNKPEHEETVIQTRKQIESRNPLAFAPKVIRTLEPASEIGEEANTTPASARHKRGCNCKKSSCLKKYCECYQSGVGCSASCRCEGCKNTFGRKYGTMPVRIVETDPEESELSGHEKDLKKPDTEQNVQNDGQSLSDCLPITPSCTSRSFTQLPLHSTGKPPRSSTLTIGSTPMLCTSNACMRSEAPSKNHAQVPNEDETPDFLLSKPACISGLKIVSPSRKRISPPRTKGGVSPSRKGCRKLILKSIPSLPPLTSDSTEELH